jgi:type II secretory pathway component GspD/PulD (secretin)
MAKPIIPDSVIPLNPQMFGPKDRKAKVGKRVVFVTPHITAAEETKRKYEEKFYKAEIEKEKDDEGKLVYVVYVL